MNNVGRCALLILVGVLVTPVIAESQERIQSLLVSGGEGSIPVTQMNGRNYVDVEALARAAKGSLSFNGNQVILTLGDARETIAEPAPSTSNRAADSRFSSAFLRAGIEAMSTLREWHSALASAIENGYPVTKEGLARYQGQATTNLRLAQAAATTDADRKGAQLIENVYQKMKQLSDKYVSMRANMNYIAPDALENDSSNQNLVACGKALSGMAASGQFSNETACQ